MGNKLKKRLLGWILAGVLAISGVPGFAPQAQAAADAVGATAAAAKAAAQLSVAEAIARGNSGEAASVTGYIVGHASGSQTADFEQPYANDFNFLIADAAGERDKTKLVDVQIPAGLRAQFGLQGNPGLIGRQVNVSGSLATYNNFPGLKNVTAIELTAGQPDPGEGSGENPGENPGQDPGQDPGQEPGQDPGSGNPDPGQTHTLPDGAGKKVLFDNTHAQTSGAADWIIDGGFSDFADGLRAAGFSVDSLDRPIPYTFGEQAITYEALRNYDAFIIAEANIPFKVSEQEALVQYVQNGGAVFFIADHYNADRNKNRWDASEVFNGYRRGAYENPAKGMTAEEAGSPAMQGISSTDWLADNFGVRFRYNALGDINATDIVSPSQSFGITTDVKAVAVHAGSTVAILDPQKAKGIVYVPTGAPAWGSAVDSGVYNGGGRAEGAFVAVSKLGLGKAAFIGDSSPVEDATPKYKREENGQTKTTYDGFKEVNDGLFLVQAVKWLAYDESYTSLGQVPGLQLDTPTKLGAFEEPAASTEPQPEPWAAPAAGYKWYDPATFKPGSYGSSQAPSVEPTYAFVHQAQLPGGQEFQIRLTVDGLLPGQTVSDLSVGFYLPGGEQIARYKDDSGNWSDYNYSPAFSVTGNAQGHAAKELTVQFRAGVSGGANLRLKRGSANVITKSVTIADVSAEPLPGDHPAVPELASVADARQAGDGTVVTVQGVITSEPGAFGGQAFYLQDETAGIYVYQTTAGYHAGDLIRISATKTLYNGEVELENPVVIEVKGTASLPEALDQDAVDDSNQGRLITLQNVVIQNVVQATPAGSFEFDAVHEDGSMTRVRVDGRTGIGFAAFNASFPAGSRINVTGISSVFKGTFQLKPLTMEHFALYDAVAPVTTASVEGKEGQAVYNLTAVTIAFSAEDAGGSGLARTEYRVNGGEWANGANPVTLSVDGKYVVEYRSLDKAGNAEAAKLLYINVDQTAPQVLFTGEKTFLQTESAVPFTVSVQDQVSGVVNTVYTLDGKNISGVNKIIPLAQAPGQHTLVVQAGDAAGHKISVKLTFEVTMDIAHLDELINLGEADHYFKLKGISTSLLAQVASLQKSKTGLERDLKIMALQITIGAQSGLSITKDFAKLLMDDLDYISRKAG